MTTLNNSKKKNKFPADGGAPETSCTLDVVVNKITCDPSLLVAEQVSGSHTSYDPRDLANKSGILLEVSYKSPCDLSGIQFKLDLDGLNLSNDCKYIRAIGGQAAGATAAVHDQGFNITASGHHVVIYDKVENKEMTTVEFVSTTIADYEPTALDPLRWVDIYFTSTAYDRFYFDAGGAVPPPAPPAPGGLIAVPIMLLTTLAEIKESFDAKVSGTANYYVTSLGLAQTLVRPKVAGNFTDSSQGGDLDVTTLLVQKKADGKSDIIPSAAALSPLCYILLGDEDACSLENCPDEITVSDIKGTVNANMVAPKPGWTGETNQGIAPSETSLYYCIGLMSGKNAYNEKFNADVRDDQIIDIVDLITLNNKVRDLSETGGTTSAIVPTACCKAKDEIKCTSDVEILNIKAIPSDPNDPRKNDLFVTLGYVSPDSVAGVQFDIGYDLFIDSDEEGDVILEPSLEGSWSADLATVRNRFGYDKVTRIAAFQLPYENAASDKLDYYGNIISSDKSLKKYTTETLSNSQLSSGLLQEYSLPASSDSKEIITLRIKNVNLLNNSVKAHFVYDEVLPVFGGSKYNSFIAFSKGDSYYGPTNLFNGQWFSGDTFNPSQSVKLKKVYDDFRILNIKLVTNSVRTEAPHSTLNTSMDYIGKRLAYSFDTSTPPFSLISSRDDLTSYLDLVLKIFTKKALLNNIQSIPSLSRYKSRIAFIDSTDTSAWKYTDNGYNTDANLSGTFDVGDVVALSNLGAFRKVVGIADPASLSEGNAEETLMSVDYLDANLYNQEYTPNLTANSAVKDSQVDYFVPSYICSESLCTNSMPQSCPDICDSDRSGILCYMRQRVDTTAIPPKGFRNWKQFFYDTTGLTADEIPDIGHGLFSYFEVYVATNTAKTRFVNSAKFSLDLCETFCTTDAGTFYVSKAPGFSTIAVTDNAALAIADSTAPVDGVISGALPADREIVVTVGCGTDADGNRVPEPSITNDSGGILIARVFLVSTLNCGAIDWTSGRKVKLITGTIAASNNYGEVNYVNKPYDTTIYQYNTDPTSEFGYMALGPNSTYSSNFYIDNSSATHFYGEYNLHLKTVDEDTVDVEYCTDTHFDRITFGVKNIEYVSASIDPLLYVPSEEGYYGSVTTGLEDGLTIIDISPTGSVTPVSGSGTLCRLHLSKNMFDRELMQTGRIFACPPLGGNASSRELLLPDEVHRDDITERGIVYAAYDDHKLAFHLQADYTSSSFTSTEQNFEVIGADPFDPTTYQTVQGYVPGDPTWPTVSRWINPYYTRLSASIDNGPGAVPYRRGSPMLIAGGGHPDPSYVYFYGNEDGHDDPRSYMSGSVGTLADGTDALNNFTILMVFAGLNEPAGGGRRDVYDSEPQQLLGTPYYTGGQFLTNGNRFCLRMGEGGKNGTGGQCTTMPGVAGQGVLSFTLAGVAGPPALELYHTTEASNPTLYLHNVVAIRGSNVHGGDMRVNGALANGPGAGDYAAGAHPCLGAIGAGVGTDSDGNLIIGWDGLSAPGSTDYNAEYLNASISEVLIYSEYLSDEELYKMEGYLAHKWSTNSLLPGTHPYKVESELYTFLGDTEEDAQEVIDEYIDPYNKTFLSQRAGAKYITDRICIRDNTKSASIITTAELPCAAACPGPVPPVPWSPADLGAALTLWIDPSDASTITGVGSAISQIDDKAGVVPGISFQQSVWSQQPTVLLYDGLNWMSFDGLNDQLLGRKGGPADLYLSDIFGSVRAPGTTFEVHLVMRPDDNSGCGGSCGNNSANPWSNTPVFAADQGYFGIFVKDMDTATPDMQVSIRETAGWAGRDTTYPGATGVQQVFGMSMTDPGASPLTGPFYTYEDGVATTIAGVTEVGFPAYTTNPVHFGSMGWAFTYHYRGLIGEMLVFDRELTPAERTNMTTYLSAKWGTP